MKMVRAILWFTIILLVPALTSGCSGSKEVEVPAQTAGTERTVSASEAEADRDSGTQSDIISWFTADINGDDQEELLIIKDSPAAMLTLDTGETYGTHIMVYSQYAIQHDIPLPQGEPDYQFDLSELKPLFIQAGDINGDGTLEIAVCVYKTAEFHPVPAKRPFFYDLKDGQLEPVWLGSRLARPFADYTLFDIDHDDIDEIISIEFTETGSQVLAVYEWKGFGFEVKAISDEIQGNVSFLNNTNSRSDMILVEIEGETNKLQLEEGEVIKWLNDY